MAGSPFQQRCHRRSLGGFASLSYIRLGYLLASWASLSGPVLTQAVDTANLSCLSFTGDEIKVPADWINDGYCDCPTSGADEPLTNACAGMEYWPIGGGRRKTEIDPQELPYFPCPQQPKLLLLKSKVNDGICDCCDGADESDSGSSCPDICEQVLAEERAERERMEQSFLRGYQKRKELLMQFAEYQVQVEKELAQKQTEIEETVEPKLEEIQREIHEYKRNKLLKPRLESIDSAFITQYKADPLGFSALSEEELVLLIIHVCQLAGEMVNSGASGRTCVPLRLAGLDAGIVWQPKTYQQTRFWIGTKGSFFLSSGDEEEINKIADVLNSNIRNSIKIWTSDSPDKGSSGGKRKKNASDSRHRRLTEIDDDDDDDDDYIDEGEEDYLDEVDDDFISDDADMYEDHDDVLFKDGTYGGHSGYGTDDGDGNETSPNRDDVLAYVRGLPFSASRISLVAHASKLIEEIDRLTKEIEDAEKASKEKEGEGDDEIDETVSPAETLEQEKGSSELAVADPVALPIVKNRLKDLDGYVNQGFDYAVSAKVLLDELLDSEDYGRDTRMPLADLHKLAYGTLAHAALSATDVWQIFQQGVLAAGKTRTQTDSETCKSPWDGSCPPPTVDRKSAAGGTTKLPPALVLPAAKAFCDKIYADVSSFDTCVENKISEGENIAIPADIPDGYLGYYEIHSRTEDDPLADVLKAWSFDSADQSKAGLDDLVETESDLADRKGELEKEIKDLKDSVGAEDPEKFGPDGELHSLRDVCLSLDTGKYTYELCMFASAAQKDVGSGGRGTDLGKWIGHDREEETGMRVWKWGNGARCWKGPSRSATAYVTCGEETKVLNAEEPEMCVYEFDVKSPLACDDDYRIANDLPVAS